MNRRGILALPMLAVAGGCERAAETTRTGAASGIRFLSEGTGEGFRRVLGPRLLQFPADHGSHPEFRTEWWYFTGNLLTPDRRHYGFQLTFFRYALTPTAAARESAWATNQIWMGHLAVTDTANGDFVAEEKLARGALGLAGASGDRFEVRVEDWRAATDSRGRLTLAASTDRAGIDMRLEPLKPIVLQGNEGYDRKGPEEGNASHYYSWTRLAATGSVAMAGHSTAASGTAWLDREWGTSALGPGVIGWSWFALQLDDGRDLMIYRLRNADGSFNEFSSARLVEADGSSHEIDAGNIGLEITRRWQSSASGTRYPVGWRISVPAESLELHVEPVIDNQELLLSVRYWEGAVRVEGTADGAHVEGRGYLELAGYSSRE